MRTVIILSFLALLMASTAASSTEPVSVGGDFGTAWLNNQLYQSETSADDDENGLWNWGGVPTGMEVVNGSLQSIYNDTDEVDYADVAWLEAETQGQSASVDGSSVPVEMATANSSSTFNSDDPWILAQHYEKLFTTPSDYYG